MLIQVNMDRIVLVCTFFSSVLAVCDRNTGRSGVTECFKLSKYNNQYQWGTCLTDSYIQTKSSGKYKCADRSRTYCYYQCMLEVHKILSGPVYADCSCRIGEEYTTSNLSLPTKCYSPSGTSCDWYEQCLERKHNCRGTKDDYGVAYATKFCNLYDKYYSHFSYQGQQWIDAVRKCLQVSLVPLLRPWRSLSCKEVKTIAFNSHVPCYIRPNDQSPHISICHLGAHDFFSVFWTIKSGLVMSVHTSAVMIKGFWSIMTDCIGNIFKDYVFDGSTRNLKLRVQYADFYGGRRRRSLPELEKFRSISNEIVDNIADKLDWKKQGVLWFSDIDTNTTLKNEITMNIYLTDRKTYDLNAPNLPSADMNSTVANFKNKLQNGELSAKTKDFSFKVLAGCSDADCETTLFDVTATNRKR